MGIWILLVLVVSGPDGKAPEYLSSVEFLSERSCLRAAAALEKDLFVAGGPADVLRLDRKRVRTICVEK